MTRTVNQREQSGRAIREGTGSWVGSARLERVKSALQYGASLEGSVVIG